MTEIKLDILGRSVGVVFAELRNDEGAWLGEYDDEQRLIRLDRSADYWTTLLHEVMHAAFRRVNFQPGDVAEEILADVLAAVIAENFTLEHRNNGA